jgi:hypothetical protein
LFSLVLVKFLSPLIKPSVLLLVIFIISGFENTTVDEHSMNQSHGELCNNGILRETLNIQSNKREKRKYKIKYLIINLIGYTKK